MSERRNTVLTVLRLVLASLVVGLLLSFLDITPAAILQKIAGVATTLWTTLVDALGWAGSYILLGALVVVPLWALAWMWRRLRGREP